MLIKNFKMNIKLNNNPITTESTTIADLLEQQSIETKGIAVAVNRRVVPRTEWNTRVLNEGDEVVVVSAVYGG